jgi:hypothetical protein
MFAETPIFTHPIRCREATQETEFMTREASTGSIQLLGDKFPEIEVQTTRGKIVLPKSCQGKWFVLFSRECDIQPVIFPAR